MDCPRCASTDTRLYDHKPPRKHPPGQTGCGDECTQTGLLCRRCRIVSPLNTTIKKAET